MHRSLLAVVVLALLFGASTPSRADLMLTLQPGPGVDINNVIINQPVEIDLIASGSVAGEFITGGGGSFGVNRNTFINASTPTAASVHDDLTTDPVVFMFDLTPTALGLYVINGGFSFTTNDATYDNVTVSPLDFTVVAAPQAVPEPASLTLFGAGLAMLGVMRRKRKAS